MSRPYGRKRPRRLSRDSAPSTLGERPAALGGADRKLALAGMAPVTVERRPRDAAVVALAAVLALDDLDHRDLVGARLHDEDVLVADLALKADAVEPVGKHDRGHLGLFGFAVHDDVAVLRAEVGRGNQHAEA